MDIWPDPWALDQTDPALRRREVFPLSDAGRAAAAQCMKEAFEAEPERWKNTPPSWIASRGHRLRRRRKN